MFFFQILKNKNEKWLHLKADIIKTTLSDGVFFHRNVKKQLLSFYSIAEEIFQEWTPWKAPFREVYPEVEGYAWYDVTQKAG